MATSEYIRLTPDQQSKNGAIWSLFWAVSLLTIYLRAKSLLFKKYFFIRYKDPCT